VKVSYDSSGPWIGPDIRDSTLQFVPNWKAITIPETTPRPKAMPNIFSQNSKTRRYTGLTARSEHCDNWQQGNWSLASY